MVVHKSPEATKWKRSQLPTIPDCVGVGVVMPLPVLVVVTDLVVVVVPEPRTPTQRYVLSQRLVH